MNPTQNIILDIASLEADIAAGTIRDQGVLEQLRAIKKRAMGQDRPSRETPTGTLASYRQDAVEQLKTLRDILQDKDLQTVPDFELFHLSCGCDLATTKVYKFFHLRNNNAARNGNFDNSNMEEKSNGN
jgi:hypothetical protein